MEKILLSDMEKNAVIKIQFKQQQKKFYLEYSLKRRDLKNTKSSALCLLV